LTRTLDRREFLAAALLAPLAARIPARLDGGGPLALVTADLEEHVVAVDVSTGRVVRRIGTAADPRSIEAAPGGVAVVCHTAEGAVTLLDTGTLRPVRVLRAFAEPRYTAAAPGGRYAYVTDSGRGEVAVLDLARGRVVHRTEVGGAPRHLALHPSGRLLWAALGNTARHVAVLDLAEPARPRLRARIRPPFLAHDVVIAPDGTTAWVTAGTAREVGLYDVRTRRLRTRVAADAAPQHVAFLGRTAFVTSGDDGALRVHAAATGRRLARAAIPSGSYNVQHGWGRILTASLATGEFTVLDGRGRTLRSLAPARSSHDVCFAVRR
jgi:DNA-binding beta-propeller fold protein YncE